MNKQELVTIVNDETGIYTPEQKAKATRALADLQNQPNQTTSPAGDSMLAASRRELLERLVTEDTAKSKQALADLAHNWPDFATTGKVLGE
jgi:hypothetical protein